MRRFVLSLPGAPSTLPGLAQSVMSCLSDELVGTKGWTKDGSGSKEDLPGLGALADVGSRLRSFELGLARASGASRRIGRLRGWPVGRGEVPRSLRKGYVQLEVGLHLDKLTDSKSGRAPTELTLWVGDQLLGLPLARLWEGEDRFNGMADEGVQGLIAYDSLHRMLDLWVDLHNSHYLPDKLGPSAVDETHGLPNRRKALRMLRDHLPLLLAYPSTGFATTSPRKGIVAICRMIQARDRGWVPPDHKPEFPFGAPSHSVPGAYYVPPGGFVLAALARLGLAFGPDLPEQMLPPALRDALDRDEQFTRYHVLA